MGKPRYAWEATRIKGENVFIQHVTGEAASSPQPQPQLTFHRAPRLDPDAEQDVNAECTEFGFLESDGVEVSPDGKTAQLKMSSSQVVVSKDWVSKGHTSKEKSWDVHWKLTHSGGMEDVVHTPCVGITNARSFDDNQGFTIVFDVEGNIRFGLKPTSVNSWLMFRDEAKDRIGDAITEINETNTSAVNHFRVTINIQTVTLTVEFGKPPTQGPNANRKVVVELNKLVQNAEWEQARVAVLLQNSHLENQRPIPISPASTS